MTGDIKSASGLVLGIDPGTRKVGYAVVASDGAVLSQGIVDELHMLDETLRALAGSHRLCAVALGAGTNVEALQHQLEPLGVPIVRVNEYETTLRARMLYFADHPPKGWRKLIPLGMQVPPRPIDDYAAVLIARRYLTSAGEPPDRV
jgi:RNase H-fold protein (predicted Holliday junction resolvase)